MTPIPGLRQKPNKLLVEPEQHERRLAFCLESADEPPGLQPLLGLFWGSCSSQIRFWDSSVIAQWFERIDVCATLNEAGGKDCLCNPLETLHRNGLAHRTFSDQLTRQHMILDNAQTLGARLRQQL